MEVAQDPGGTHQDDFEKETGESEPKSPSDGSKVSESNKASPDDGVVVEGNVEVPDTTGGKNEGVDEADSAAVMDEDFELVEDEVEPEVSLRDSGIGLDPQPSPTTEEPKSQPEKGLVLVEETLSSPAESAPFDSQPDAPAVQDPTSAPDDAKSPTSDISESSPSTQDINPKPEDEPLPRPDLKSENDDLKRQLKTLRGDYEEKVGILELELDGEREKVEEQARRIKELQKLLRKQQDDDLGSQGSGDIKEKAKAAASLQLERDYLVKQYREGKSTEECLRQTVTDLLEEKEMDQQKIKDLNLRLQRTTQDHEAKDKRMAQLQTELRDVTALVTQLEEHMDKVKIDEARRKIQATKTPTEADSSVTNNQQQSRVCIIL